MWHSSIDYYAHRSRFLHLDPRIKLVCFLALTVATALLSGLVPVLLSLVFVIGLFAFSSLPVHHIAKHILYLSPFAVFAFVSIFPFKGAVSGAVILVRVLACGAYVILLSSATPFLDLLRALQFFRFPRIFSEMFVFLYRYIFVFAGESRRMSDARKARGFRGGRSIFDRTGLHIISSSAGMILYRAYHRGLALNRALLARGYRGRIRTLTKFRVRGEEAAFLSVTGLVIVCLYLVQAKVIG